MMASCCKTQYFLNPGLFLHFLAQMLVMTWHFSVTEGVTQLTGEIGGNVTFHCLIDKERQVRFFYLQRGDIFVNGFHPSPTPKEVQPWKNTELSHNKTVVHMYGLNVSHRGEYECHVQYEASGKTETHSIYLSLTGKYNKPQVTTHCSEITLSCVMTCSTHGGYPDAKVTWSTADHSCQMCKVLNSSEMEDPDTKTYNISSTAHFNCSNKEIKSLSCSVGNVTSDPFSVCNFETSADNFETSVIIAATCVMVFMTITIACLLWWKCKTGETAAEVERNPEEIITIVAMAEKSEGEEGP